MIEVLAPYAEEVACPAPAPVAGRLAGLAGRAVGLVLNSFAASEPVAAELARRLADRGARVRVTRKTYWQQLSREQLAELAGGSDAVIVGLGATPPATAVCVRDSIALERLGIATVTLASEPYAAILAGTAATTGMPDLKRVLLPGPLDEQPDRAGVAVGQRFDQLVAALTEPAGDG